MLYVIIAELNDPQKDYTGFHDEIHSFGPWAHYTSTIWAVDTTLDAKTMSDRLRVHTSDKDFHLILPFGYPYQGWLPKDFWDWLNQHRY